MLIIDGTSGKRSYEQILEENKYILAKEMIDGICDAIDLDVPKILIAIIKCPGGMDSNIHVTESFYKEDLEECIKTLVKYEEYEICAKAKHYIDSISIDKMSKLN